jgi:hypothetical protein
MKNELALWRFGAGLLGGNVWLVAVALCAMVGSYAGLIYVATHPLTHFNRVASNAEMVSMPTGIVFFGAVAAITALRQREREPTLLRLAPGAARIFLQLTWRLAWLAIISVVPFVILRAVITMKLANTVNATATLADVPFAGYALAVFFVAHVALLIALTFGLFRVPLRFVFAPVLYAPTLGISKGWSWFPLGICAILIVSVWCWRRFDVDAFTARFASKPVAQITRERTPRWVAWQQRRATRATGRNAATLRVTALLGSLSSVFQTLPTVLVLVLYMTLKPGFMDAVSLSWLMAYLAAALLLQLSPIPLARVMLLPLGVERARMGEVIAAVWHQAMQPRWLLGVILGLTVHAFCWWIKWPAFLRSPMFESFDVASQLLWAPLAQALGFYGMALSTCLLASASPRLLERFNFLPTVPFTAMLLFAAVGLTLKWCLNELIPATQAVNAGHITFAVVNGVMLPALAWCVNRALRYQWATANLSAISAAMQAWSARLQKMQAPF